MDVVALGLGGLASVEEEEGEELQARKIPDDPEGEDKDWQR